MNRMRVSSDEEECVSKEVHGKKERRHSQRLDEKRHRKTFNLPSREKIWDQIPTLTSPPKHLRLKKVVNEFTKVHNAYNNADAYEDSNESSVDSESSDDSDEVPYHKGFQHIANHHRRIVDKSSSSDDEDGRRNGQNTNEKRKALDLEDKNVMCESILPESFDDENTKDSEDFVCVMRKRKVSAFDSDEDKNSTKDSCTGPSNSTNTNTNNDNVSESESSNSTSNDTSYSDSEADTDCNENESRAEMLKRKKKNLFDEFKAAQAKRRKSEDKQTISLSCGNVLPSTL